MSKVFIYGHSDDLVEVDGDITEEFACDSGYIVFDNGTMLKVEYSDRGDGCWRFEEIINKNSRVTVYSVDSLEARSYVPRSNYTEVAVIEGDFNWVACSSYIGRIKK